MTLRQWSSIIFALAFSLAFALDIFQYFDLTYQLSPEITVVFDGSVQHWHLDYFVYAQAVTWAVRDPDEDRLLNVPRYAQFYRARADNMLFVTNVDLPSAEYTRIEMTELKGTAAATYIHRADIAHRTGRVYSGTVVNGFLQVPPNVECIPLGIVGRPHAQLAMGINPDPEEGMEVAIAVAQPAEPAEPEEPKKGILGDCLVETCKWAMRLIIPGAFVANCVQTVDDFENHRVVMGGLGIGTAVGMLAAFGVLETAFQKCKEDFRRNGNNNAAQSTGNNAAPAMSNP